MHVHQPYRVRHYTALESGADHNYFETDDSQTSNHQILNKVATKSYIPTNKRLLKLLSDHPEFKLSLSITGTVLEQLERWQPDVLHSFQELVRTGRVEIVAETYHHSLAFFYSRSEFEIQVKMHEDAVQRLFKVKPTVFRNTELSYNNEVAQWAEGAGYQGILAEGWDPILGWRSPNFAYRPAGTEKIKLLLKNYRLSDDIAFRFGDQNWKEWPMTADKFAHWLNEEPNATNFDLFMDYETFGEHQWEASGIFDFLEALPKEWLKTKGNSFMTVGEASHHLEAADVVDVPDTITWADTERDLSAWLGNAMQQEAIAALYELEPAMIGSGNLALIEDWRRLQTSDHFYYMSTKFWNDGDIHAYFSPYDSPFEAYINFMNAYHDLRYRLIGTGATV
jgi:alpha-amylase